MFWPCGAVYIGAIRWLIETRLSVRQRSSSTGLLNKSAVTKLLYNTDQQILFNSTTISVKSLYFINSKIREAMDLKNMNHEEV